MLMRLTAGLLALGLIAGCGGAADRGKNKDRDVPKPADVEVRPAKDEPRAAKEQPARAKDVPADGADKAAPKPPDNAKPAGDAKSAPEKK